MQKLEFFTFIKRFGLSAKDAEANDAEEPNNEQQAIMICDGGKECRLINTRGGVFSLVVTADGLLCVCDGKQAESYALCDTDTVTPEMIREFLLGNKIICYDAKSLYKLLEEKGILYRDAFFDVMLGAYVVNPGDGNYSLDIKLYTDVIGKINVLVCSN